MDPGWLVGFLGGGGDVQQFKRRNACQIGRWEAKGPPNNLRGQSWTMQVNLANTEGFL